ncbi:MAG: transketolase [Desulfomonilaceae bacterium]
MDSSVPNFRKQIVDKVMPYARTDDRIILLVCDMGFGVTDKFREEFPDRIYNMGMMEQGTVGIAAGMAMTGLLPIVYSIVNFLAFRALEQIRNDVVLQGLNVKFIATGVNDYFRFLGPSHCCGKQDIQIMQMIGMKVYDPYSECHGLQQFDETVNAWLGDLQSAYIRV